MGRYSNRNDGREGDTVFRGRRSAPAARTGTVYTVRECLLACLILHGIWMAGGPPGRAFGGPEGAPSGDHMKEESVAESDTLTQEEGERLISVARETIEAHLFGREAFPKEGSPVSPRYAEKRGTFVTLTVDGGLRGCIGHILPTESILEGVEENALNAAFRDPRFPPLSREEWPRVNVEVSILTEPRPLSYDDWSDLLEKLRPGVDGVILRRGSRQATFLPQVWEQLPGKADFLTHLCLKAGLSDDAWKTEKLDVSTYQVQAFEE